MQPPHRTRFHNRRLRSPLTFVQPHDQPNSDTEIPSLVLVHRTGKKGWASARQPRSYCAQLHIACGCILRETAVFIWNLRCHRRWSRYDSPRVVATPSPARANRFRPSKSLIATLVRIPLGRCPIRCRRVRARLPQGNASPGRPRCSDSILETGPTVFSTPRSQVQTLRQ